MPCSATLIRRPTRTAEGGDRLVGVEGAAANTFIGAMPRILAGSTLRIKNQARTVTMASASVRAGQPVHEEKSTSWLGKVFELNPAGLNWPRAVMVLDVLLD